MPARRAVPWYGQARHASPRPSMHRAILLAIALPITLASCRPAASVATRPTPAAAVDFTMADALQIADRYRVAAIAQRRMPHAEYWRVVQPMLASARVRVEEVGRSMLGRELRSITFGSGPVTVLLWSQMHGDEATATMALADMLAWMTAPEPDRVRDRMSGALTVVMIPMLNPDGAERFQREN